MDFDQMCISWLSIFECVPEWDERMNGVKFPAEGWRLGVCCGWGRGTDGLKRLEFHLLHWREIHVWLRPWRSKI